MKTNLLDIESELFQISAECKEKTTEYKQYIERYEVRKKELLRQKEIVMNGLDLDKIKIAERVLAIRGLNYGEYNDRCINAAIQDIASGNSKMNKQYFGVKNYAHWRHQESDHPYGYGPSHGSVVFSVGLKNPQKPLTEEEKNDCLYYLNLLKNKEARYKIANIKKENVV